ncbi:MAG TPA: bacillithiol system redox-active protein YtxJ [Blastocatellia bacterium]|nr:bacillithiol system redox-active protein YtxJ [Blastocatellia bacterium]
MTSNIKELTNMAELEEAIKESKERPVLFFKHSTTCPISARAYREFKNHLEEADSRVSYKIVTVQAARPVSNEIALRLQVQHETPQAILVKEGREVWNASHFSITSTALEEAIRSH